MATEPTEPIEVAALQRQIEQLQAKLAAAQQANLTGSGAVAQVGGVALGERAVKVEDNAGTIVTGTQIVANYYGAVAGALSKEQIAGQVAGYLRWLRSRTECIELRGIERAGGAPVVLLPLETAYVPLRAKWMAGSEANLPLSEVLGLGNRLVIVGGPGSGKTTVLVHMAWALASSLLTGEPEPARSRLGLKKVIEDPSARPINADDPGDQTGSPSPRPATDTAAPRPVPTDVPPSELPLPLFVPLASFARFRRNLPGNAPARDRTLAHFISYHLISKQADFDLPADFFVRVLKDGRDCLLLLDGLDEVANESERAEVRQSVDDLVAGRDDMRVVVTCRTAAYRSRGSALGARFREIVVQPLEFDEHIAPMVRQAYHCIYPLDDALRGERVTDLLAGIRRLEQDRRARLGKDAPALVDSPLMVRLLLIVHVNNRRLPDERADLFDKAINALLQVDYGREEGDIRELSTDWKPFRDMAQHLAFHMHGQGRDQGREIEEADLKAALGQEADFVPRIDAFLQSARQRGSVLEEQTGVYRFIHLAFQEFLAARYLREVIGGAGHATILDCLADRLEDPWWREPILLLASYLGAHAAKSARDFLAALAQRGKTPNAQFAAADLAATAVLEWRESGDMLKVECARRILTLLGDPDTRSGSAPAVRADAEADLERLGDPRFDPACFYLPADELLGFVRIPADPDFMIGTRRSARERVAEIVDFTVSDAEINDIPTPTAPFYIARYPVTVAQFRAFCAATGGQRGDAKALCDPGSRPVRFVGWHEALAYCRWLNEVLMSAPVLAEYEAARLVQGGAWQVALPSELEWERAARGGVRELVYPWGDGPDPNRANYADTKIGDTLTVGCFPANGFGLYDMIGNVWEWTRSRYASYPYRPRDGRENPDPAADDRLVVRGGSWGYHQGGAHCAYRSWIPPDPRNDDLGFRVVLRSAPVS
ncbi:SUMF1/EgtB/PvdO family nonheme iron enzyme [uncultured Thiodictyon sp.]|jgi:formylglycine-generating enzyme required for sulfatase activity|uniref:SUMF1/EgtB/PvdO family nonheme iron enzyme n=1 Tax=uncultured Thiodictyon sp. TaxID=1846217 RepID=UPI0025E61FB5|nr:SUMF1/EgtB/PvdO family nonheme iron enzyme [uncultured Thiodictyon sp.]